jgi:hypothetical protein
LARRAIVHIGMPRTGSTTLQHILAHAREGLEKAGILYPDLTPRSARAMPHISHQHFGETLDGRRPRHEQDELLQGLSDRLARTDCDVVIVSYEDFFEQQPRFQVPHLLNSFFARHGFTAEALVVVKPQSEFLNSIYTLRTLLMRERQGFAHFIRGYIGSGRFAYDQRIQPWIDEFSGRVCALPVRDRRFPRIQLVPRMLTELGIHDRVAPLMAQKDIRRVENRSPGPVAVEVSRRLRAMRTHARLRVRPREMMNLVQQLTRERGYDRERFNGVSPELRAELAERYRAANDRFARAVWNASWDEIVAPEQPRPVNELVPGLIDHEIETAITEIIDQASRQFAVTSRHSALDTPLNLFGEQFEALQRRLGILSLWRVA